MRHVSAFSFLMLLAGVLSVSAWLPAQPSGDAHGAHIQAGGSNALVDPDILDSEWNHHFAGYLLIGIGLLVFGKQYSSRLRWVESIWPLLFVGAALFLAIWSDKEIWPRGALSWSWLFHHDAEARQHKFYAILLLAMGSVEYLRSSGKLGAVLKTWAFPMLAVLGAGLLLFHEHGGNSGLPPGWDNAEKAARIAQMARAEGISLPVASTVESTSQERSMPAMGHHDMEAMNMPHMDTNLDKSMRDSSLPESGHNNHIMTGSMLHVKEQHLWFTIVGIAVALLKFIDDGSIWRRRFVPYLWPTAMCVLGTLLVLYTEVK